MKRTSPWENTLREKAVERKQRRDVYESQVAQRKMGALEDVQEKKSAPAVKTAAPKKQIKKQGSNDEALYVEKVLNRARRELGEGATREDAINYAAKKKWINKSNKAVSKSFGGL